MTHPSGKPPIFRFAPSPNGLLHLGHAYSALLNRQRADAVGGQLLLRIEDIDASRARPEYEAAIIEDLDWLGLRFDPPLRRQSDHVPAYAEALDRLKRMGLVYPAFLSRGELRQRIATAEGAGRTVPRDPDGTPLYPPDERALPPETAAARIAAGEKHAWRIDMDKARAALGARALEFSESGSGRNETIAADPARWGDVVLSRSDAPSSYHLSVVVDDAAQGVTEIVRGRDLFAATDVHCLLQDLLGLPRPRYHHHRLILDEDGRKLSKSLASTSLRSLRAAGTSAGEIRRRLGF